MNSNQIYLSTIDSRAYDNAKELGLGVEIAEFCTAMNMDQLYDEIGRIVEDAVRDITPRLLHGPFNELYPCAIDPKARELAAYRFNQALDFCRNFNAKKLILHAGFVPRQYYPVWFIEESVLFWKEFLSQQPDDIRIVIENVLENDPQWMFDIVNEVKDPRLKLCLDVGHANVYSDVDVCKWIENWAPCLDHFHIHNNYGENDTHNSLFKGSIPMNEVLELADSLCPNATFTMEFIKGSEDLPWLKKLL